MATARRARRARTRQRALAEWIVAIGLAVLGALAIRTWSVQAYVIPSESMLPTLEVGDRVLVSKMGFDLEDLERGHLIVFKNPQPRPGEPDHLIKRVIGLPGDTLETKDGVLLLNGERQTEAWVLPGSRTLGIEKTAVAPGTVFVLGDNRERSADSREKGPIDGDEIVGRAFLRMWPVGRIGGL